MSFGITEIILLLAIVLLQFGAGKLPTVMGDLAKGIRNFKTVLKDDDPPPTADEPSTPPRLGPPGSGPQ